jgi:prepilin-type N-terminal cleavage/methylation domain-containing protein
MSRQHPRSSPHGTSGPVSLIRAGRSIAAFTLTEMLVVIAILAIVAAVVLPKMVGSSDIQARSAARVLMADLEYAQSVAITSQTPITVTFSTFSNSYAVSNASGPLIHPITKKSYVVDLGEVKGMESVAIASASFGGSSYMTFDALGAPDNSGTVTIAAGAHTYQVNVAPVVGRITVTKAG